MNDNREEVVAIVLLYLGIGALAVMAVWMLVVFLAVVTT